MTFYEKFKVLCDLKGISCNAAATEIGLSNSIVTKWKKDSTDYPRHETMLRIAEYFEVDVSTLYGLEEIVDSEQKNEMFNRIRNLCQMRQTSIKAMCNDLHISPGNLSDLKHGRRQQLSLTSLIKIAQYFDVSTDQLLGLQPLPAQLPDDTPPNPASAENCLAVSENERNTLLIALLMRIQHLQAFTNTQKEALSDFGIDPGADKFLQLTLEEIGTLTALVDKLKSDPTAST